MGWSAHVALWLAVSPPVGLPATVEFRWLGREPAKGLTEAAGIRTTCGDELSYPHAKPVLTHADVASASLKNHGSVMGLAGDHYMVSFHLSERTKRKLAGSLAGESVKRLACS